MKIEGFYKIYYDLDLKREIIEIFYFTLKFYILIDSDEC